MSRTCCRVSLCWLALCASAAGHWACTANRSAGGGGGGGGADGGAAIDGGVASTDGGSSADGGVACSPDVSPRPRPRAEAAAAFDSRRGKLVFFGGDDGEPVNCNPAPHPVGEAWDFSPDCRFFASLPTSGAPGARARALAVHDPVGDRILFFGGRFRAGTSGAYTIYNEVWAFDLAASAWSMLPVTGAKPTARSSTAGGYNARSGELILFGGNASTNGLNFTPLRDVWALNPAAGTWRSIATTGGGPTARLFHAAAVDGEAGQLYVYGGGDANAFTGPFLGDLWKLDLESGAWERLHAAGAGAPASRIQASLAFDGPRNRLLLFGGHDDGQVGNNNDTWSFDLASGQWGEIIAPETVQTPANGFCSFPPDFTQPNLDAPDRRALHAHAHDATRERLVIFGGRTDCGIIDDVWVFDLKEDTWSRAMRARFGEACSRGDDPSTCTTMCH